MKRIAAIVLSLMFLWLRAMAAVQTTSVPAPVSCSCCSPQKACCCVEQSVPDAVPLAAAPVPANASVDFTAAISKLVAWTLPANAPAIVSSTDNFSSSLAVPLFARHCARLI